jgi:hypothetical protein
VQAEREKIQSAHVERVKSFVETHDDFEELMQDLDGIPVPAAIHEGIVTSEHGPALMYELAKNPEEFKRICALPPIAAARALGLLEAKLASAPEAKPEPKKTTKAPEPIAPVSSKGASREKTIFDPDLTQAEYERLRAKQRTG